MTKRSLLGWINLLLPKDGGTRRVLDGEAYGPDPRQALDVYAPRDFEGTLPILFFIYGGGWDTGERADYEFAGRAFAGAGFLTVIADYRLVPDHPYPDFLEDCGRALAHALSRLGAFGGDPDRVFFAGHSAGAYNAAMLALDGERFGVPPLGERLRGVLGLSGPYDFYPFDVPASIAAFSHTAEPERTQPVNLVTSQAPPFFLGHGRKDTICGTYNTENLAKALRQQGVSVVERYYDGLDHPATLLALFPWLRWRAPVYRECLGFIRTRS